MKNEKIQWKKWNWLLYGIAGFLCPPLGFALFVYFDIKDPKIARGSRNWSFNSYCSSNFLYLSNWIS